MSELKRLMEVKRNLKKKSPFFLRQDAHKRKKIPQNWRKPKGLHSKMRLGLKSYRRKVDAGFRGPVLVRGLDRNGLMPIRVMSVKDIEKIDPKKESVIIGNTVGNRKKIAIIEAAKKKGIIITNIKVEKFMEKINTKKQEKGDKKKQKIKKEKVEKKEDKKEELSEEDKKKQQTKEKEKVLTKRI